MVIFKVVVVGGSSSSGGSGGGGGSTNELKTDKSLSKRAKGGLLYVIT